MKKVSKILLTIGGIINILAAVGVIIAGLIIGIMSFVGSGFMVAYMGEMMSEAGSMGDEAGIEPEVIIGIISGLVCIFASLVGFILFLISGIVALKAPKAHVKGKYIACIVWSVLTESIFLLVGGIFGIIAVGQDEKAQSEPEPAPAPAPAPLPEPAKAEPVKEEPKEEAKPEPAPARKDWFCPNCGAHNEGKFCAACGTKKPE